MSNAHTSSQSSSPPYASGYRIKFDREKFIEMVEISDPKIIYKVENFYYFAFDGFVMYTNKCRDTEFSHRKVMEAKEFSNSSWSKK